MQQESLYAAWYAEQGAGRAEIETRVMGRFPYLSRQEASQATSWGIDIVKAGQYFGSDTAGGTISDTNPPKVGPGDTYHVSGVFSWRDRSGHEYTTQVSTTVIGEEGIAAVTRELRNLAENSIEDSLESGGGRNYDRIEPQAVAFKVWIS